MFQSLPWRASNNFWKIFNLFSAPFSKLSRHSFAIHFASFTFLALQSNFQHQQSYEIFRARFQFHASTGEFYIFNYLSNSIESWLVYGAVIYGSMVTWSGNWVGKMREKSSAIIACQKRFPSLSAQSWLIVSITNSSIASVTRHLNHSKMSDTYQYDVRERFECTFSYPQQKLITITLISKAVECFSKLSARKISHKISNEFQCTPTHRMKRKFLSENQWTTKNRNLLNIHIINV